MPKKITSMQQMSVGQIAARSGVAVSTLHFYESKGLLKPARSESNQRVYGRGTLRRIAIIKVAQRAGIPLAEVKQALAPIPHDRSPSAAEWQQVSATWAQALQQRIDALLRLKNNLDFCIGCGCLSMLECPLRNPDDQLGEGRSGPVLIEDAGPDGAKHRT